MLALLIPLFFMAFGALDDATLARLERAKTNAPNKKQRKDPDPQDEVCLTEKQTKWLHDTFGLTFDALATKLFQGARARQTWVQATVDDGKHAKLAKFGDPSAHTASGTLRAVAEAVFGQALDGPVLHKTLMDKWIAHAGAFGLKISDIQEIYVLSGFSIAIADIAAYSVSEADVVLTTLKDIRAQEAAADEDDDDDTAVAVADAPNDDDDGAPGPSSGARRGRKKKTTA